MSSFADYLEQKLLDHAFKSTAFSQPTNLYLALYTAAPSDAGGGTEVTGGSYARKNHNLWGRSGSIMYNSGSISFTQATASWGTVTHFAILDTSTGGNFFGWGTCTVSRIVSDNDTAEFASSTILISLD